MIDRLEQHGVSITRLAKPVTAEVRSYRFKNVVWKPEQSWHTLPYEGRHLCEYEIETVTELRTLPAGSALVDTAQRTARVIAHILEPAGPDSFVHWGFFNPVFRRVEYVESYVMEEMARKMLEDDPSLAAAFEEAKLASPEFAADSRAILTWFYEKTPYYDSRENLYPVSLIDDRDVLEKLR